MPEVRYRLFLDNEAATREQLDRVEEITVEQQIDMAWEARFQIPICTDDKGRWTGEAEEFMGAFKRWRLEVKVADQPFVPLIDGPVVGSDHQLSSEPGQSSITVIVQDDSVFLNREEKINPYIDRRDSEIAQDLFSQVREIGSRTQIDSTPPPKDGLPAVALQRGTQMDLLRRLAHRCRMYAYVLPGTEPGKSIGVFGRLPRKADGLPTMILVGSERNVKSFQVKTDAQSPAVAEAFVLSITDKAVTHAVSRFRDVELLGKEGALREADAARRLLPPGQDGVVDPRCAVDGETDNASFAFCAYGTVIGSCYPGVLSPYRAVPVKGVNGRLSGDFTIERVTHWLTRSDYVQTFSFLRNAVSSGSARGAVAEPAGKIL